MKKITTEQLFSLMEEVRNILSTSQLSLGQAIFNVFSEKHPVAASKKDTGFDPYSHNQKIIFFMREVLDEEAYMTFLDSNLGLNLAKKYNT